MKQEEIMPALDALHPQYIRGFNRRLLAAQKSGHHRNTVDRADKAVFKAAFNRHADDANELRAYLLAGLDVLGLDPHADVLNLALVNMVWPEPAEAQP